MGAKWMLATVSVLSALVVSGCSSPQSERQPEGNSQDAPAAVQDAPASVSAVLAESGYCSMPKGAFDPSYYQYSAILENPSQTYDLRDVVLRVEGKDATGATVFAQDEVIPLIAAGDVCPYAGKAGNGTYAASLEFSVLGGSVQEASAPRRSDLYAIEDPVENIGWPGGVSYSGSVRARADLPADLGTAKVIVLLRDRDGNLTAGYSTVADQMVVGEATPFKAMAPGVPQHSSFEVFAIPWE